MAASSRESFGKRVCFVLLCLATFHLMATALGGAWWSLGITGCARNRLNSNCSSCGGLVAAGYLTDEQNEECTRDRKFIRAISRGARDAIVQCQNTFEYRKWNCSTFYGSDLFGNFINSGTRETAVLNAYFSIGSISALAIACREQRLLNCPCVGQSQFQNTSGLYFEDCAENLDWAVENGMRFIIDSQGITTTDPTRLELSDAVGVHNVELGKDLVVGSAKSRVCRCHGISGTCTVQSCYDATKSVEELSEILFARYLGAVHVRKDDSTNDLAPVVFGNLINDNTLVFEEQTPDLCLPDPAEGILGTRGRQCSIDFGADNFCGDVCCEGLFRTIQYQVPEEVCKFVFCCRLECDIVGNKTITEHLCTN